MHTDLIICGSGTCVWDDLYQVISPDKYETPYDIMAVNDVGMHIPHKLKHWYSNDIDMLPHWRAARRPRFGLNETKYESIELHSCYGDGKSIKAWDFHGGGTSSLGALWVSKQLGYTKVYLCGVPMDCSGHYFNRERTNYANSRELRTWESNRQWFPEVIAMSGNIKEMLAGRLSSSELPDRERP